MAGIEVQPYTPTNPLTAAQGAFGLANTIYQGQNIQANTALTNTQNQQAQTNLATGQMNRSFQVTAGLLNLSDGQLAGGQAVRDALSAEHQAGTLNDNSYSTALSSLPAATQSDGSPTPASAWRQVLTSHLLTAHSPADEYNRTVGTVQSTTLPGGMTQYMGVPGPSAAPGASVTPIGQPVGGGMSPEASNDIVTITSPVSGRQVQIARQDVAAWSAAGYPTDNSGQPTGFSRSSPQSNGAAGYAPPAFTFKASNLPNGVSPDEDAAVRTMLTEASPGDVKGETAVGATINNRARATGQPPLAIVTSPNQYSAWNSGGGNGQIGPQGMARIDSGSPAYQTALAAWRGIQSGKAADPTNGATHYYSPAGMPGGAAPSWAVGHQPVATIGGQRFFNDIGTPGAVSSTAQPPAPVDRTIPSPQDMEIAKNERAYQQSEVAAVSGQDMINKNRALDTVINLSPTATTGKGTGVAQNLATVVSNISPVLAKSLGIDPAKQADRAELLKNMYQYATTAGNGTDAKLIASQMSSPNENMPPATARAVARTLRGVNNYFNGITQEAAAQATNDPKNLSTQFGNVRTKIASGADINAFLVPGSQIGAYLATLPKAGTPAGDAARLRFHRGQDLAEKYAQPNSGALPSGQ